MMMKKTIDYDDDHDDQDFRLLCFFSPVLFCHFLISCSITMIDLYSIHHHHHQHHHCSTRFFSLPFIHLWNEFIIIECTLVVLFHRSFNFQRFSEMIFFHSFWLCKNFFFHVLEWWWWRWQWWCSVWFWTGW